MIPAPNGVLIVVVMAAAWILVAAYEWTASRQPIAAGGDGEPVPDDGAAQTPAIGRAAVTALRATH